MCRDLAPPEDIDKAISDHERKSAGRTQPLLGEPSVFGRLRDMGVSFVTPSDLNCSQRRSEVSSKHYTTTVSKLKARQIFFLICICRNNCFAQKRFQNYRSTVPHKDEEFIERVSNAETHSTSNGTDHCQHVVNQVFFLN